jgi:hypothetical protein
MTIRGILATRAFLMGCVALAFACRTRAPGAASDTTTGVRGSAGTSQADSPTVKDSAGSPVAAAADSVTPLLETGCSGGLTGGGSGTFVTASGHFYRFQRNGPAPNAQREITLLRRDSAAAAVLVQAAERAGIARIKYSDPSNVTCYLSLDRGGTSHEVEWPIGTSPTPIRKLVDLSKQIK